MPRISAVTRSGRKLSQGELLERQVTAQVRDYLKARGWRAIRNQVTVLPGAFQTGTRGMPDFTFLRYLDCKVPAAALCLWIEVKRPSGKLSEAQVEWHSKERLLGGTVWTVDDFDWFVGEYERAFGWLHTGDTGRGQLELLAGIAGVSK